MDNNNELTYIERIQVPIPAVAQAQFNIGQKMPQQIKTIYGISTLIGGVTPLNQPIIVAGNELNLYVNFLSGANSFIQQLRLSELVYSNDCIRKFLRVNLDADIIDLDTSYISNPTNLVVGTIVLYLYYIPK